MIIGQTPPPMVKAQRAHRGIIKSVDKRFVGLRKITIELEDGVTFKKYIRPVAAPLYVPGAPITLIDETEHAGNHPSRCYVDFAANGITWDQRTHLCYVNSDAFDDADFESGNIIQMSVMMDDWCWVLDSTSTEFFLLQIKKGPVRVVDSSRDFPQDMRS